MSPIVKAFTWGGAVLGLSLLLSANWSGQSPVEKRTSPADTWSLGSPADNSEADAAFAELTQHPAFRGTPKPPPAAKRTAAGARTPDTWRFLGTISIGQESLAIVRVNNDVKRYRVGDTLTDGSEITKIGKGYVQFRGPDAVFDRRLFQGDAKPQMPQSPPASPYARSPFR